MATPESILANDPAVNYIGELAWDNFYKQGPFVAKGISYMDAAGLITGKPIPRTTPEPDVLVAWRSDEKGMAVTIYPALLGHLAVQLDLFRLFQQDIVERKLTPSTAIWKGRSLPVVLFTGNEFRPEWIPLLIRYSITGETPTAGSITTLIGRSLGDSQLVQYGTIQTKRFIRNLIRIINMAPFRSNTITSHRYPKGLRVWRIVDISELLMIKHDMVFYAEFTSMLSNFNMYQPELTLINERLAIAHDETIYIAASRTMEQPRLYGVDHPALLSTLPYCHLIAYLRGTSAMATTVVAALNVYIENSMRASTRIHKVIVEYTESERLRRKIFNDARVQLTEQLKAQLIRDVDGLQTAVDMFVEYLRSQPGGEAYTDTALSECSSFDTFAAEERLTSEEFKDAAKLAGIAGLYSPSKLLPEVGLPSPRPIAPPQLPLSPQKHSSPSLSPQPLTEMLPLPE